MDSAHEAIYNPENVSDEHRPIFDALKREFGLKFQIWHYVNDYGRLVRAEILNPETRVAAKITLLGEGCNRTSPLSSAEIQQIRNHFDSGIQNDLGLNQK